MTNADSAPGTQLVLFEQDGPIARLTLNRERQLNALNAALMDELSSQLDRLATDKSVRVVFITGAGRAFAAGADIAQMEAMGAEESERWALAGQATYSKIERLPQPVIALVNGFALGGGMELAMACDVRIVSERAKFGQPEVHLGILPGFGGSQRLPRLVGQGRALEWLLAGDMMDAAEAHRIGLANQVVATDELDAAGRAYASRLLLQAPGSLAAVKRAVYEGAELDQSKGLALEAALFGLRFGGAEQREGMSAFLAKRDPAFAVEP
jgi:enoyl-CoA hydratase